MTWRNAIRPWIPPALLRRLRRARRWGWHGDHADWAAAHAAAGGPGYADPAIVAQVEAAVREVLAGRAAFERDGIAFAEPEARWNVLACLLRIRCQRGRLRVLDLGGSLATVWLQHRAWLPSEGLRWLVVEQPGFIAAGRRVFPEGPPEFADDLDAALADGPWDAVLVSNALQYLDDPEAVLARIADAGAAHLILDRLAMTARDRDRITVQRVPEHIYRASYPCRFFAEARLDRLLAERWCEQARWEVDADLPGADGCRLAGRFLARAP